MEEEKLLLNKIIHFSFNQESISYIMDIEFPCLVDLKFPCVLSQWSQTHGLIHLNFHKHCLCEGQCALVPWDICHPIPLLRENERWVHSLPCIPFVSACKGLGTMAAREGPGWPGSCRSTRNSQLAQLCCRWKVVGATSLKMLKASLDGAVSSLV